jgi:hypothetical protein
MDKCLTDQPRLVPVSDDGRHLSACWLPATAAGLAGEAEELRRRAVERGRNEAAAKVAEAIAKRPESEGSVTA